jgi:Flp pilus assembly protein TadG
LKLNLVFQKMNFRFEAMSSLARDRRGTVFVLFSLLLPVAVAGFLGLVSLFNVSTGRADLQAASDAAANAILSDLNSALALSAIPDALVADVDKQARANSVVQSILGGRSDVSNINTIVVTTPDSITVTVSARFQNVTGDLLSLPYFINSATTTVSWARADQLQIAIAIDSGSTPRNAPSVLMRMSILKPILAAAIDILSAVPNYPDIAVSVVPFTAQIVTDPAAVVAELPVGSDNFTSKLQRQFAQAANDVTDWFISPARAGVTACYSDPIVTSGADGSAFGGTSRPLPTSCSSSLPRVRSMTKISRPYVKGQPSSSEPVNSPAKLARDDIKAAINSISPAGCRNLTMGTTWSLAQLPKDTNPKIIFMIVNGNNSQSSRARTADCAGSSVSPISTQAQLDAEFVAACDLVRDPTRNNARRLDLIVLQAVDGNPTALKACASTTDGAANYFSATQNAALPSILQQLNTKLFQIATKQKFDFSEWQKRWKNNDSENESDD